MTIETGHLQDHPLPGSAAAWCRERGWSEGTRLRHPLEPELTIVAIGPEWVAMGVMDEQGRSFVRGWCVGDEDCMRQMREVEPEDGQP